MAADDGLSQFQSFSERTLKYGRNVMAASLPIIVFAWADVVDLAKSRPFNFEIKEGGEIWMWWGFLALLIYYGFRFFGLAFPNFLQWRSNFGSTRNGIKFNLNNFVIQKKGEEESLSTQEEVKRHISNQNDKSNVEKRILSFIKNIEDSQKNIILTQAALRI